MSKLSIKNRKTSLKIVASSLSLVIACVALQTANAVVSNIKAGNGQVNGAFVNYFMEDVRDSISASGVSPELKEAVLTTYSNCASGSLGTNPRAMIDGMVKENASCALKAFEYADYHGLKADTTVVINDWLKSRKFNQSTLKACQAVGTLPCGKIEKLLR